MSTVRTSFQKMKRVPLMMTEADRRIFRMRALLRIMSLTFRGGCRRVSLSTGSTPKLLGTKRWNKPLKEEPEAEMCSSHHERLSQDGEVAKASTLPCVRQGCSQSHGALHVLAGSLPFPSSDPFPLTTQSLSSICGDPQSLDSGQFAHLHL